LKRVDVNDVIKDTAELVKSQGLLKDIDLTLDLATGLSLIEIDPYQLSQVLINLILNSRDAILRDGVITISSLGTPNEGVEISVRDNGVGIPKEIIDKIFDPFFTTKDPGRGTGLGLSVSQRIVQHFGGRIRVQNEPEIGSVFRITFPGVKDHGSQGSDN
jgi:signal transduction histidine kinase